MSVSLCQTGSLLRLRSGEATRCCWHRWNVSLAFLGCLPGLCQVCPGFTGHEAERNTEKDKQIEREYCKRERERERERRRHLGEDHKTRQRELEWVRCRESAKPITHHSLRSQTPYVQDSFENLRSTLPSRERGTDLHDLLADAFVWEARDLCLMMAGADVNVDSFRNLSIA